MTPWVSRTEKCFQMINPSFIPSVVPRLPRLVSILTWRFLSKSGWQVIGGVILWDQNTTFFVEGNSHKLIPFFPHLLGWPDLWWLHSKETYLALPVQNKFFWPHLAEFESFWSSFCQSMRAHTQSAHTHSYMLHACRPELASTET